MPSKTVTQQPVPEYASFSPIDQPPWRVELLPVGDPGTDARIDELLYRNE